jgi:hypothetical protein
LAGQKPVEEDETSPTARPTIFFPLSLKSLLANAVQTSMYALDAHVYSTSVRATGVAYPASLGRVGGLIGSLFGAAIIQAGPSAYWEAPAVAMISSAAGLAWVRGHYPAGRKIENA